MIIRLILSPLSIKTLRSQKVLSELHPKVREIQEKFKNDAQKQTRQVMEMYKQYNINPFSGCLPLLIQLPILIALYQVSIAGFEQNSLSVLYEFIKNPGFLNQASLGFIDLTKRSVFLSAVAGVSQFLQTKLSVSSQKNPVFQKDQKITTIPQPRKNPSGSTGAEPLTRNPLASMNQQMLYFLPIITIIVSMSFPAGLPLYWIATTLFSIAEQLYIARVQIKIHGESNRKPDFQDH